MLWLALTLNILRHQQMVAVVDDIGELANPVAKDNHPGLFRQLEVYLDMPMAIDKVVDIGVILDVLLCEKHQMFALVTHVGWLLAVGALQPRVLGPVQSEPHAPAGVQG